MKADDGPNAENAARKNVVALVIIDASGIALQAPLLPTYYLPTYYLPTTYLLPTYYLPTTYLLHTFFLLIYLLYTLGSLLEINTL